MEKDKIMRNISLYGSLFVTICVYLYQIYSQQLRKQFELTNYIEIIFISVFFGMLAYLLLCIFFYVVKKYTKDKVKSLDLVQYTFYAGEAERNFDEVTDSIHKIVVDSIEIPQFDSDLVDDMGEKVAGMLKITCMAYVYGLLSVYCVGKNSHFMCSDEKNYFQNMVMKRVADYRKKLAVDFEDEHVTNQELSSNASKMIADVTEIVNINLDKNIFNKNETVDELIENLMNNINVKIPDISASVRNHSEKVLDNWKNKNTIYV